MDAPNKSPMSRQKAKNEQNFSQSTNKKNGLRSQNQNDLNIEGLNNGSNMDRRKSDFQFSETSSGTSDMQGKDSQEWLTNGMNSLFLKSTGKTTETDDKKFAEKMQKIVKGLCTCGKCRLCYFQKRKMGLGPNDVTIYKKDYPEHPLQRMNPLFNRKPKDTLGKGLESCLPMMSIKSKDFTDPGMVPNETCKPDEISNSNGIQLMGAPFPKQTIYNNDFIDWKQKTQVGNIKPSNIDRSKFKMAFSGNPCNADYGDFPYDQTKMPMNGAARFGKSQYENPLAPKTDFNGRTMYQDDYTPFELDDDDVCKNGTNFRPTEKDNIANARNFSGRFKTTYLDYKKNQLKKQKPCPAKKLLKKVKDQAETLGLIGTFKF